MGSGLGVFNTVVRVCGIAVACLLLTACEEVPERFRIQTEEGFRQAIDMTEDLARSYDTELPISTAAFIELWHKDSLDGRRRQVRGFGVVDLRKDRLVDYWGHEARIIAVDGEFYGIASPGADGVWRTGGFVVTHDTVLEFRENPASRVGRAKRNPPPE